MTTRIFKTLACTMALSWGATALAIPGLQLDIGGGTYNGGSETTIASGNTFNLYALFKGSSPSGTYYISAALLPSTTSGNPSLGSFVFDGTTVNVASGMAQGTPFNLQSHGVFDTYYKTFAFTFNTANKFDNYDVSLVSGTHTGPTLDPNGDSVFQAFSVDLTGLAPGYEIHFDLFNTHVVQHGSHPATTEVDKFAPFSHDAEGGHHDIPDGGLTVLMLGSALAGLGTIARRIKK